jgi:hypothetical protein
LLWKLSKPFFFTSFLEHILRAFLPYVALYGASLLIDGISNGKSLQELLIVVYWMAGIAATGTVLQALLKAVNDSIQTKLQVSIKALLSKKTFSLSYSQCEDNETMRLVAAADEGANGSGDVGNYMVNMATLVEAITSIVFGLIFLWPLFSKVQTTTNEPLPLYLTSIWAPLTILGLVFLSTLAVGLLGLLANTISYKVMNGLKLLQNIGPLNEIDFKICDMISLQHFPDDIGLPNLASPINEKSFFAIVNPVLNLSFDKSVHLVCLLLAYSILFLVF